MQQPSTISEYIRSAPDLSQDHLQLVYKVLREVAPHAEETIKWSTPFFIEPRFLFAFAAQKAHLNFAPSPEVIKAFSDELKSRKTTKNYLQVPYTEPVPEELIRRMAEYRLKLVSERDDEAFW